MIFQPRTEPQRLLPSNPGAAGEGSAQQGLFLKRRAHGRKRRRGRKQGTMKCALNLKSLTKVGCLADLERRMFCFGPYLLACWVFSISDCSLEVRQTTLPMINRKNGSSALYNYTTIVISIWSPGLTSLCSAQTRGARHPAFQQADTIVSDCGVSRHKRALAGLV